VKHFDIDLCDKHWEEYSAAPVQAAEAAQPKRATDPNAEIRDEYARIMRAAGLRVSDWPLVIRRSKRWPKHATGYCRGQGVRPQIFVTLGIDLSPRGHTARTLLLHEVAHALMFHRYQMPEGHRDRWRAAFVELTHAAYGVRISMPAGSSHDLHAAVEAALFWRQP
jgi:hypothetical protein